MRTEAEESDNKRGYGIVPAELVGDYRANANVVAVSALFVDVDEANETQIVDLVAYLEEENVAFFAHPTFSMLDGSKLGARYRFVFALDRDVVAAEWSAFWPRALRHLGLERLKDASCKDPARFYFDWRYPPGTHDAYHSRVRSKMGAALAVDAIMTLELPKGTAAPAAGVTTSGADRASELGALAMLLEPHFLAGKRNELRLRGAGALRHAGYSQADAETLFVELLAPTDGATEKARATVAASFTTSTPTGFKRFAEALGAPVVANQIRAILNAREDVALDEMVQSSAVAATAAPDASRFVDVFAAQPPVPWIVQGIDLAPGPPTIVGGFGFSGKTIACQALALTLATGRPIWGSFPGPRTPVSVLHLDYEQGARLSATRYQRLARGLGVWQPDVADRLGLVVVPEFRLDEERTEELLAKLCEGRALVIIDSLRAACPSVDENSSDARRPLDTLFRVSEHTGAAFVVIHHAGKGSGEKAARERLRGSSALFDACQSVLIFEPKDDGRIRVEQTKARLSGVPAKPFTLEIVDVAKGIEPAWGLSIKSIEVAPVDEVAELERLVLDCIRQNPGSSVNQVKVRVGKRQPLVSAAIQDLSTAGRIFHQDRSIEGDGTKTAKGWYVAKVGS